MAPAEWFVPELSVTAAFDLEKAKRILRANATSEPERVAELACQVFEQNVMQQSILKKAVMHVAELEQTIVLAAATLGDVQAPAPPRVQGREGQQQIPWPVRFVLWLYRFDLQPETEAASAP